MPNQYRFLGDAAGAIDYLEAAARALPRTLGDRDSIAAMDAAMCVAIDSGMVFRSGDMERLQKLRISTCVGNFDPIYEGYYRRGCIMGGTYPRMYESEREFRPWIADLVWLRPPFGRAPARYGSFQSEFQSMRVAPGFALAVRDHALDADEAQLQRISIPGGAGETFQLWWCTSLGQDEIKLCRYPRRQDGRNPLEGDNGKPVRRWTLGRQEWAAAVAPCRCTAGELDTEHIERPRERCAAA